MRRFLLPVLPALALLLAACAAQSGRPSTPTGTDPGRTPPISAGIDPFAPGDPLTRVDQQGAIIVEVTPSNLAQSSDEIEFDVALNTHSVDLGMDLAARSTLNTDTGLRLPATIWDAPLGGHHVKGKLIFHSSQEGAHILEGVSKLTLTIEDLGAPTRVFEWDLE